MGDIDPYAFPESFVDFAFMPHFADHIEELSRLAEPECWDYKYTPSDKPKPVLRNYLGYTYKRVAQESKVAVTEDEEHACWDTGLVTPGQEPIYIVFNKNKLDDRRTYWHFWKFARKGQAELTCFSRLPDMAHYFDDPASLVYDARKELRANIEHIIEDNCERLPAAVRAMSKFGAQNLLKGAIDSARERVKRNYRTAVPQCYKGRIQLLLPLCMTDATRADLAMVVEPFPDFYRAATCLTLDMAYNNARQLARPDRDWLEP